ncbi:Proteasome assembly chaperone 4 like [Actinidia chinensis var. chinensis]|uniref:Proteasome assembly chaperone 4 like n=1 Tax=Actinidia chinensis var. chinensis TaxID=1590841 RepID=A0A2R6PJE9_ACTCC|nr:Proteasome assembly chaperone 4 like [Actinidia chinensis var. chinensis]
MAPGRSDVKSPEHGTTKVEEDFVVDGVDRLGIGSSSNEEEDGVQVTCFTDVVDDVTLHFQLIRLHKQIYAWIGCNSAKFGHVYAAAPTRPNNTVSVTNILGGASDNTGSGIVRRLVLKTGLNVILACNIPKNSPMLEADAEKKLVQKLINLGYTKPKSNGSSS